MKLIMENWRQYLNEEEQPAITTVGDLRSLFKGALSTKRKGALTSADVATELGATAIGMLPFGGMIASAASFGNLLYKAYHLPDEKKTNTGLDYLNVDDEISAIVDNNVETAFLKVITKEIEQWPDETPLENTNITSLLKKYLHKQFDGRSVTGEDQPFTIQSKNPSIVNIAKQNAEAGVPKE